MLSNISDFDDGHSNSSSDMDEYGSEDDLPDSLSPGSPVKSLGQPTKKGKKAEEDFLGMKDYMDAMDRELAKTTISQSFETRGAPPKVIFKVFYTS